MAEDKQADREPANGLTMQERAQKNRLDERLEARVAEIVSPIRWNPFNLVVQDHRNGTVDIEATNRERAARGLSVPWTPEVAAAEMR